MQETLRLAVKGAGLAAPNPMVGAVIVKDGRVIGRGYHHRFGGAHAEIEALEDCVRQGNDPTGAIMLVNLEPCCHPGKTGPCTEALIRAGIGEVDIATLDEFESVRGRGVGQLREKGIRVRVGCCETEARRFNSGYFKYLRTGRPLVILKWAQSLDGKLAWPSEPGSAENPHRWISNEKSRRHVHQIRRQVGAILVGIGTVLADDPLLTVRLGGKRHPPRRVVLDSQLRIPEDRQLVKTAPEASVLIYSLSQSIQDKGKVASRLQEGGCEVVAVTGKEERLDLEAVLADLGKRGVTELLVEGGATILKAFVEQRLVDKYMIYIAPILIGSQSEAPKIDFGISYDPLHDIKITKFDTDILIEGFTEKLIKSSFEREAL